MAKVGGSYESVVRGVSEQVPHERRSGQMWEQVNMISDPVRGNVRRHGSLALTARLLGHPELTDAQAAEAARVLRTKAYFCDGRELEIGYSNKPLVNELARPYCYDKDNDRLLEVVGNGGLYNELISRGVSSMVNVGRYMFIAARDYKPTWTVSQDMPPAGDAKVGVVWVRQGNFSRTYALQIQFAGGRSERIEFKTPPASYPNALDTSDIVMPDVPQVPPELTPERQQAYQKALAEYNRLVSLRTQEYNSAVTSWIGISTSQIQPEYIAQKLYDALHVLVPDGIWYEGNYLLCDTRAGISNITLVDGGDDTYMRSVFDTVDSVDKLSPKHYDGKVMRISAKKYDQKDAYYVRAYAKTYAAGQTLQEVVWREAAGQTTTPQSVFCIAWADANKLYIGGTPAELNAIAPAAECPSFSPSAVGDILSSPAPMFFGRAVDYLGIFQDRLLVGSGATLFASRPGDYFNWFRQSVLTVEDSDPVEMYALGSEDDTIYWDASFDRNLVLFGKRYQYVLAGRSVITPKTPNIQIMASIEDAIEAEPASSGSYVFYGKDTTVKGSVHQIQLGSVTDSSDSYEITQALDKYIKGKPLEILTIQAPNNVVVRSTGYDNGFYIYTYLETMNGGERVFDSWSRWEWDTRLGKCAGLMKWKSDLNVATLRRGPQGWWLCVDEFTFDTQLNDKPYHDAQQTLQTIGLGPQWITDGIMDIATVAYDNTSDYYMLGTTYRDLDKNLPGWHDDAAKLWFGTPFRAYISPTSPYMPDKDGNAITTGRLTLGSLQLSVADTGGLTGWVETPNRTTRAVRFEGRLLSRKSNLIGRAPIATTTVSVPIYREIREHRVYLEANDWLPMSIVGIEWIGQWFNNLQRV